MKTTGVSQYLCTYILSIHVNSWHGSVSVLSPQPQKCSQCCAFVQQASRNNSTTHLLLHNCTIAQLHTFLTHNFSIMEYIHSLTNLFIIRKPAWTPVICVNTGTCPNSRVCINVMFCQCCLDPRFCNRVWNGEVMSNAYLAAEMKWDIHWLQVYTAKLNLELQLMHQVHSEQQKQLSAFRIYVYSVQTLYSIPGSPVSSGSDPSSSPYEWKNNMHLFNGVSWNRGKWKAGP